METPATRFVEHDGVNIAWQVFGDGPAEILFVPGWVSNLDLFSQYPYGTRIAGTAPRANPLGEDRAETRPPAERSSRAAPSHGRQQSRSSPSDVAAVTSQ
jgi:pimeloyl-ACP methyl ester carboxylesterase